MIRVHWSADPTMTAERVASLRSRYTSDARWQREMEIAYEALEGERLYPEYSAEENDCDPFDVSDSARWSIWMACDPHARTPHAFIWEGFGVRGDRVVCGELWPGEQYHVERYAEAVAWIESDSNEKPRAFAWAEGKRLRIVRRVMDTYGIGANSDEGPDFFETYRRHGLHFYPAKKGQGPLAAARDKIGLALVAGKTDSGERVPPAMRIFRGCVETRSELENVRFPSGDVERPAQERPMTYRKHMLDCLHYIETSNPGFVMLRKGEDTWKPIYPQVGY